MSNYTVEQLRREDWKDFVLPFDFTADSYYDLKLESTKNGYRADIIRVALEEPYIHKFSDADYTDTLFADWYSNAVVWGVLENGKLIGAIETIAENWNNRMRVTEVWVDSSHRRCGIAHTIMKRVKEQAKEEGRRAIVLETQSNNTGAIDFYLSEGFTLIGFDTCCYGNDDLAKREVRFDLGYMLS